jgi:nucleotide-binding universal stress UspA family protein
MFKKILVPTDGSDLALRATSMAIRLAEECGAELIFVHAIVPYYPPYGVEYLDGAMYEKIRVGESESSAHLLKAAVEEAETAGVKATSISEVNSRPEILIEKTGKQTDCDLIVISTHGRGKLAKFFLGSVTSRLLVISSVPILVYRDQSMLDDFFGLP